MNSKMCELWMYDGFRLEKLIGMKLTQSIDRSIVIFLNLRKLDTGGYCEFFYNAPDAFIPDICSGCKKEVYEKLYDKGAKCAKCKCGLFVGWLPDKTVVERKELVGGYKKKS